MNWLDPLAKRLTPYTSNFGVCVSPSKPVWKMACKEKPNLAPLNFKIMEETDLELIRDYLDDRINEDGLNRLNHLLETDAEAREEFRNMATMEEGLRDLCINPENTIEFPVEKAEVKSGWFRPEYIGIAALLVLCLSLTFLLLGKKDQDPWGSSVARIEYLSEDVQFNSPQQLPIAEGCYLGKGWLQLAKGNVRILFRSGATMNAIGPVSIGLDSPMRAFLDFGKVTVHAPESARDFVVATESMEVVDLGTTFEVGVDPQSREANVSVIEGLVDLHLGSRGVERTIRPLEAGYEARVDASGQIIEITDGSQLTEQERQPHQILGHWNFDEIDSSGTIQDVSGHQLDGVLKTKDEPRSVEGISGQALEFTKTESVDLRKHISKLTQLDAFTFAAWVRDPAEPLAMLFSLSGNTEQHRVQFLLFRRYAVFGWQDGLHYDSISGRVDGWEEGQWYHVVVSVAGGVVRLYRDGELIASGSIGLKIGTPVSNPSMIKNAKHAYIGRLEDALSGQQTGPQWYGGILDEVQIYSGALSHDAIRYLFKNPGKTPQFEND
jgi:hypothetical protein